MNRRTIVKAARERAARMHTRCACNPRTCVPCARDSRSVRDGRPYGHRARRQWRYTSAGKDLA